MTESPVAVYMLHPPAWLVSPLMKVCLWSGKLGFESLSRNPPPHAVFEDHAPSGASGETDNEPTKFVAGSQNPCTARASSSPLDRAIFAVLSVTILALIVGLLLTPRPAHAAPLYCRTPATHTPHQSISCIWPRSTRAKAHAVADCESTASAPTRIARQRGLGRWAVNGQYVGVFQMGRRERQAHGWYVRGSSAYTQVRSALSLYRDRGWSPWSCA